jgi:hypothetical protein
MMAAKVPSKPTLAFADALRAFIDQPWPPAHIDRAAHDHRLAALQRLILEWGGAFDRNGMGWQVRLNGFKATSTSSLRDACQNWIRQVTLKAASAAMAGVSA